MVRKLSLCVLLMQIWIDSVESQFGNLFGGGLGNNNGGFGGGNGLFGGGNGGFGAGNSAFGAGNNGFGAGNGGFGAGNSGFGAGNNGFGAGNNGFGAGNSAFGAGNGEFGAGNNGFGAGNNGFGAGNRNSGGSSRGRRRGRSRRPSWFRSSRLNRAVEAIVHPNARPTPEILDIAYRHRGPPENQNEMMEYIPHFARLALQLGVQHPNVTNGVPTMAQMEELMLQRGAAFHNSTQTGNSSSSRSSRRRNRNRSSSGDSGVSAVSETSSNNNATNAGPTANSGPSANPGTPVAAITAPLAANPQSQTLAGPAYNINSGLNNGLGSNSNSAQSEQSTSTGGNGQTQTIGGLGSNSNVAQPEQSASTGSNGQTQNNGGNSLLDDLLMLHIFSQANTAAGGQEGNPLMSMLGPLLSSNENQPMMPMMNNANPLMLMNNLVQNNENQNTNNANPLMMNEQQLLMRLLA